ncbi:Ig-like domain-containing protein, partial [Primorskyibacter flagellatus]
MTGFFFWDWLKHDYNYGGGSTSTDHRDGYVEGTTGNDVIGAGYTDSDGDKIDSNDAILTGEVGNDDIVIAGKGDDKVYAGKGNDEVYGGGGKDTVLGGSGDDVIYGDATRSAPGTVSNSYDCKSLWDYSSNCDKWFDWGNLVCKKLSWFDNWDNHLKLTLDKGCLLSKLNFDGASKGGYCKIFDINGKVLFEGNVSSTLSLNIDAAVKIELWTNNGCTLKSIDYAQGGFDGIDGGEADDDLLEGGLGNDTIYGNGGDDTIKGGDGNDKLYGNSGDDRIEGGKGADVIFGDGSGGGSNAGEIDLDVSGAKYTLATWSLNSFTVTGADGNVFPNSTSGLSDSKVAGATLTIKAGTQPVAVGVNDSDSRFEDGDLNQVLAKGVTINGVSAGAGSRFTPEYAYSIRPVGSSDPNDVIKIYAVELHGNTTVGFVSDKPITVGQQYTMIEKISDYPNVQYSNLADSYITADGGAAGGASGANGNDTILGGSGDDTIYGGGGNDSIEGGSGKDVIYGDNGPNGGGSTPPASGARESFEWDKAPDPNSSGAIDNNDPLSGGFSQNTGSVNVTFSVKATNESPETKFQTDQQKVHSITTDGPEADKYSSMASRLNSDDESATYQWAFSSTVSNVSFRINDIDADSKVTIKAYDLNGNLVSIDVKAESGTHLTLSDKDGVGGKETVSHSGNDTAADTSPYHSVLVNIPGPISRLEIKHEQDGHDTSEINVTDIYFDATGGGNGGGNGVAGNDTILGGSGDDSIFGEGGDDSIIGGAGKDAMSGGDGNDIFKVSSSAEGAGDVIVGGNGPDQNTDNDTLDLRGAGKVTINQSADTTDAGSYKGTVIFSDGKTLTFSQIETILTDPQVNEKPDAINDTATTDEDNAVTIDVLANDTDPEGDTLTITTVSDPANGTAAIVGGKIVYTPDANFNGTDTITYTISDGNGNTDTATVTVTVNPVNDAPVAADDAASTPEDTAVTINVLGNDMDVDGDPLTITNVSTPANGTATIVGGQIVYTPNPDFNGTDTITYTISDGNGGTDTATVTVTVGSVNDAPVAVDDTATTPEDTAITLNPLANDTDPDGDTLSIVGTPVSANGGTVTVNPNGTISYTPAPNFNGTDTITYTVTDPSGATDTATITVNVTPVNDAPDAVDDASGTDQGTPVTIDVLG